MTAPTTKSKSAGGCGCAGGSGTPKTSCSCGCGGCDQCQTESFVRPLFFAGQLLTEEDLALLGEYGVAKNRLHNRHFWGDGVVCGLQVNCQPCGGGTVSVQPGYALDCCGNDIVVPCPKELDINAMVRELRIASQGGFDCGDPCEEKTAPPVQTPPNPVGTPPASNLPGGLPPNQTPTPKTPPSDVREYCLYIRYCEQPGDPVTPYDTGDACGAAACKPTRVREGFKFELRCRTDEDCCAGSMIAKMCCCMKDEPSTKRIEADTRFFQRYNGHLSQAVYAYKTQTPIVTVPRLTQSFETLTRLTANGTSTPWTEDQFFQVIDATHDLVVYSAAQALARTKPVRPIEQTVERPVDRIDSNLPQVQPLLSKLDSVIKTRFPNGAIQKLSELDRTFATAVLEQVAVFKQAQPPITPAVELMASGILPSTQFQIKAIESLRTMRAELIDRAQRKPRKTDCTAESTLRQVYVPTAFQPAARPGLESTVYVNSLYSASRVVTRYSKNLWMECFCDNVIPPCPPCTDLSVLLACLEVKDCEVIRVCNLERKFVLTPVALRYWFPILCQIGEEIEQLCCPGVECPDREPAGQHQPGFSLSPNLSGSIVTRFAGGSGSNLQPVLGVLAGLLRFQIASCCDVGDTAAKGRGAAFEVVSRQLTALAAPGVKESDDASESVRLQQKVADLEKRLKKLEKPEARTETKPEAKPERKPEA